MHVRGISSYPVIHINFVCKIFLCLLKNNFVHINVCHIFAIIFM